MHPGRIANHNISYHEPDDWDRENNGPCWSLYGRKEEADGECTIKSALFPTLAEIQAICGGAPVYLTVAGHNMPPVKLDVGPAADQINPFPRAYAVSRSMLGNRCVTIMFDRAPSDDELAILKDHLGAAK